MSWIRCLSLSMLVVCAAMPSWAQQVTQAEPGLADHTEADRLEADARSRLGTARGLTDRTERKLEALRARQSAAKLVELRPNDESLDLLTRTQLLAGLYSEAVTTAKDWIRRNPKEFRGQYVLGEALIENYEFEPAVTALERARDLASDDAQRALAGRSLGRALEKQRNYFDAFAAYAAAGDEASAMRVREEQAREAEEEELFTNICYGADAFDEEMEELQRQAKELEAELAALEAEAGQKPGAEQIPDVEQKPEAEHEPEAEALDAESLEDRLRAQMREARMAKTRDARSEQSAAAIPTAEALVRRRPDAESLELLGQVQMLARRYEDAAATARNWVKWQPHEPSAQLLLGQALTSTRDYEAALEPLDRAFGLAEGKVREVAGKSLGFALEKLKRLDEALELYDEVGDETSARRVRENQRILAEWQEGSDFEVTDEIVCIDPDWLGEEQKRLEAELRELEENR